jgi:hypothetical protein
MPTDSFNDALERLDPASRALLDLSLRRGMRTEEIAELLGADPDSVAETRDEALRTVASEVGMGDEQQLDDVRARLAELPADQWLWQQTANGSAEAVEPVPAAPKRGSRLLPILLALLIAAGVIVAIAVVSGGKNEKSSSTVAQPPAAKLTPVGASGVTGTAGVTGGRLKLDVRGPPAPRRGFYEVWLYNSVIDARSLGQSASGQVKLNARLPADWKRYRFVDISREPKDGNFSHSGESVARVPTARLAR